MIYEHKRFKTYKFAVLFFLSIFAITCGSVRSVQVKRAKELYKKGQYLVSKGDIDRAILKFEKSMKIAEAAGFKEGVAHNLNELAIIYTANRQTEKARQLLMKALGIYKELNMAPEISKSINNIADTYVRERKFQEAIKWFDALIEWDTKTGNQLGVGITLYNMAIIYNKQLGMKEKALECLNAAFTIFKKTGNEKYIDMIKKDMQDDSDL